MKTVADILYDRVISRRMARQILSDLQAHGYEVVEADKTPAPTFGGKWKRINLGVAYVPVIEDAPGADAK